MLKFEQLGSLKQQLEQQAKSASKKETANKQRPATTTPSALPDTVVHTIKKLQKRFPRALPKGRAPRLPLKVGIMDDRSALSADLGALDRELKSATEIWRREPHACRHCPCAATTGKTFDSHDHVRLHNSKIGRVSSSSRRTAVQRPHRRPASARALLIAWVGGERRG
ncbi:ProQ/FINO family protein [Caballeronia glebae]|uniref:ProQ/FINO family protein n=1 Tax=Caballeronia glebae TaxID=1777143 RepID=UPI000B34B7D2